MIEIKLANRDDVTLLHSLAHRIWWQFYPPIIGEAQVRYMLDKFSSEEYIRKQFDQDFTYFIIYDEKTPVGYIGVENKGESLFISKFYLDESRRGRGIAHQMLDAMNELALERGLSQLELTVNKYNPSFHAYIKMGFKNVEAIVIDIGGGYVMDDYRMTKSLSKT